MLLTRRAMLTSMGSLAGAAILGSRRLPACLTARAQETTAHTGVMKPTNVELPTISGTAKVGNVLSATEGRWS